MNYKTYGFTLLDDLSIEDLAEILVEYADYDIRNVPHRNRYELIDSILAEKYPIFSNMTKDQLISEINNRCSASYEELNHFENLSFGELYYEELTETELHLRLILFCELAVKATAEIAKYIDPSIIDE